MPFQPALRQERLVGGISFDPLPFDPDFGAFRPAELLGHTIAINDEREISTRPHAADPVRECRPFDTVSAELSVLIDGVGSEKPDAA